MNMELPWVIEEHTMVCLLTYRLGEYTLTEVVWWIQQWNIERGALWNISTAFGIVFVLHVCSKIDEWMAFTITSTNEGRAVWHKMKHPYRYEQCGFVCNIYVLFIYCYVTCVCEALRYDW